MDLNHLFAGARGGGKEVMSKWEYDRVFNLLALTWEQHLAYCFELWPEATIRKARKDHRCDMTPRHTHNIAAGTDYFDSGEMDIDAPNPFRTTFRYCMDCVTRTTPTTKEN